MLKEFNGLTSQLFERQFKDMLFSIYNFAEEEFYVKRVAKLGYETDIDNLEYMILDRKDIKDKELNDFKKYVESELQNDNIVIGVLLYKGKNGIVPVIVKPKGVSIEDVLKK